jgi:hypothetical protein
MKTQSISANFLSKCEKVSNDNRNTYIWSLNQLQGISLSKWNNLLKRDISRHLHAHEIIH